MTRLIAPIGISAIVALLAWASQSPSQFHPPLRSAPMVTEYAATTTNQFIFFTTTASTMTIATTGQQAICSVTPMGAIMFYPGGQ